MTFCYTLFTFIWMVVSPWRWEVASLCRTCCARPVRHARRLTSRPMLLLILPYMLFLASRQEGRLDLGRFVGVACVALLFGAAFVVFCPVAVSRAAGGDYVGQRSQFLLQGARASRGRRGSIAAYPIAGAGLTGEPFVETEVMNIYVRSSGYSSGWMLVSLYRTRLFGHKVVVKRRV